MITFYFHWVFYTFVYSTAENHIPFKIYFPITVIIYLSSLLGRFSARCRNMAVGICVHSTTRALVKSDVSSQKGQLQFIPKLFRSELSAGHTSVHNNVFIELTLGIYELTLCIFNNILDVRGSRDPGSIGDRDAYNQLTHG